MKKTSAFICSLFIILCINFSFAQKNILKLSQIATFKNNSDWLKFKANKKLNPETLINDNLEAFGLTKTNNVKNIAKTSDNLGFTHYKFQQYYNGVKVENAVYLIHAKNGIAVSGNGNTYSGINVGIVPNFSSEKAIQYATKHINAEKYMWENQAEENLLKTMKNNSKATYFPQPELIILKDKANYKLAYKMSVYAQKPISNNYVFVDAQNGEIIKTINRIQNTDVPGIAHTKYAGTQNIITDSVGPGVYRLRETTNGGGIQTFNMNQGTNYGASVDFTDTDNDWNNVNAQQDEAATDAHFGAEKTLAYFKQKFNRDSYDNANAILYGFVHYDVNYANASWDGVRMTYGDGDGSQYSALTSLDVAGHEISHAVTEHSANLIYQDESGALNESFSDIFGTCIEFFADSANGDWYIGEDFDLTGANGFRSMSDPNSKQNPDTYYGQYWVTDGSDMGGVHTNSGVQNYWFYLLSDGGIGTNDLGRTYNVTGIGIDSAAQIAYRNLTVYLTESSNYMDARQGAIAAAEDLYGSCSMAAQQTANAWYAVGVGYPIAENDIWVLGITSPVTGCGVGTDYTTVQLLNNGCSTGITAGDTIPVFYRVDGTSIIGDSIILVSNFNPGDTLTYTIQNPFTYSIGVHTIDAWTKYSHDPEVLNDTIYGYSFENKLQQNIDVGVTKILSPISGCHLSNIEPVKIQIRFFGCDSLAAGENIAVGYKINSGTAILDTIVLPSSIFPGDSVEFTFSTKADLSASGSYNFSAWTQFDVDTLNTNDGITNYIVKNPISLSNDTVTFEESNINNMIVINTTTHSHAAVSTQAHNTGAKGFLMTGGNAMDIINILEFPNGSNTWQINSFLSAKVSFCVDATAWTTANMRFDLKQTFGKTAYEMFLGAGNDYSVASNLRVLVNGVQKGGTYNPTLESTDPFATHLINLDAYAGTNFTVTFETRNISKDTIIFTMDNAYLDNICFSELPQNSIEEVSNAFQNMSVSPNPSNGLFNLQFDAIKNTNVEIQVLDVLGRSIRNENYNATAGLNRMAIDLGVQPKGVYFLRLQSPNGSVVKKIIKE
ncbi:MAG: M4 family metallopeptidase [Bacteroidetes bacterium]|nr:M4 family metallopeptidase [Bacteroidota bacterium]